jgi:proline iminopeptidase
MQASSKVTDQWRYPPIAANRDGYVSVDEGHELHWEEYGAPGGEPVMFLHGGPGGTCAPVMARFFDPARYRVILFDQRGCGLSRPTVAAAGPAVGLRNNTTDHLVGDINRLRQALGITGKMHVFGGSWGSTLALVYAIRHPEAVAALILRGIFLGAPEDLAYMYQGNAASFANQPYAMSEPGAYIAYPEEWKAFVEVIPPSARIDMMAAYKAIFDRAPIDDNERAYQARATRAWSTWEGAISNMIPDAAGLGKFDDAAFALSFAQIEAHYFVTGCSWAPNYIVDNVARLTGVATHIVHGRFDQVCPLPQASRLVQALESVDASPATYVVTTAGHSAMESENVLALTAIMDGLPPLGG